MRHKPLPIRRKQQHQTIRRLVREAVHRMDVIDDIHDTLRSLLSHAGLILGDARRDFIEISVNPDERERKWRDVEAFYRSAVDILSSLRESIWGMRGEEAPQLMDQVERAEDIIERVYGMCATLFSGESELLSESTVEMGNWLRRGIRRDPNG